MTIMRWDAFNDAHHRRYMIFADVEQGQSEQAHFELLRRLAFHGFISGVSDEGTARGRVHSVRAGGAALSLTGLGE